MKLPSAIISDADGTLVDTVSLIRHGQFETIKNYLANIGLSTETIPTYEFFEQVLHDTIGGSAHETLKRTVTALYSTSPTIIEKIDFDKLHELLNPTQDVLAPNYVKAYEGLTELFEVTSKLHVKFAIFTSGTSHHVVRNFGIALPELGLSKLYEDKAMSDSEKLAMFCEKLQTYFKLPAFTIVTCEDVTAHKPDPESLLLGLNRLNANVSDCLVFGDHEVDIQAGLRAGIVQRVGVTHGFSNADSLLTAGATETVTSLPEFTAKLNSASKT